MIVGAAVVPAAPALLPDLADTTPADVATVRDAARSALDALPEHDVTVLLAAAPGSPASGQGLYDTASVDLRGMGRADLTAEFPIHQPLVEVASRLTQYPMYRGELLPVGLAVLALQAGNGPFVPLAVPRHATFDALVSVGTALAEALADDDARAVLVAAGDLSAGLGERSPLHVVDGAAAWDEHVVDLVASGRLDGLARCGPEEARRVGALGWAPLSVLHGACARAKLGLVLRHYSAPRGVGYLVALGA